MCIYIYNYIYTHNYTYYAHIYIYIYILYIYIYIIHICDSQTSGKSFILADVINPLIGIHIPSMSGFPVDQAWRIKQEQATVTLGSTSRNMENPWFPQKNHMISFLYPRFPGFQFCRRVTPWPTSRCRAPFCRPLRASRRMPRRSDGIPRHIEVRCRRGDATHKGMAPMAPE